MSFIPFPPEDDEQRDTSPDDESLAPPNLEPDSDNSEPPALAQGSDDLVESHVIELPLDPALADALANVRETDSDPPMPESFRPPRVDDVLDTSMFSGPDPGDPVAAFEQQSWQDTMDRLTKQVGPSDGSSRAPHIQHFLGMRDAPHRIEQMPLLPGTGSRASKIAQLAHRRPDVSESDASGQQPVLDIQPSTGAAPLAGDFPLVSTASQPPAGHGETRPLGHPRPIALVQLAEYEQFFLAEQNALIHRLTELARQIAKEEIDHAAWVDYIHQRAILGPH